MLRSVGAVARTAAVRADGPLVQLALRPKALRSRAAEFFGTAVAGAARPAQRRFFSTAARAEQAVDAPAPDATKAGEGEGKPAIRKRILSGVQPTGSLHLGNYIGAIRNWVALQEEYDNFFCVVDMHAITAPHDPKELKKSSLSAAAIYIACGIDPAKSAIFIQSHVKAHAELCWLLNCTTPLTWLERMIQFKEKAKKQGRT
eukprot:tig00000828_g4632.t1